MKRVSSEKKPCSRPSSARTSPSRSPTTKVLPSSTLRVRSDTRERRRDAPGAPPTGRCARRRRRRRRRRNARSPRPGSPARDRWQPADGRGHRPLVVDEKARPAFDHELAQPRPRGNAITGVPQASASTITMPNGSSQRIGISSPRARANSERLAAPPTSPTKRTRSPSMCGATSRSKNACWPGWMTPASTSGTSAARAAAIARCGPFSGRHPADPEQVVVLALLQRPGRTSIGFGIAANRAQPGGRRRQLGAADPTSAALCPWRA